MSVNGREDHGSVWRWNERLFTAEDLRREYQGQTELVLAARTIVSPLALDELKARKILVRREERASVGRQPAGSAPWLVTQEIPDALVQAAVAALAREGVLFGRIDKPSTLSQWLRAIASEVAWTQQRGAVAFSRDAALLCCLANRMTGLRAAAVTSSLQAARVMKRLGANVLAVEMPGPSYFEIRGILRTAAKTIPECPAETARLLQEVESHANR